MARCTADMVTSSPAPTQMSRRSYGGISLRPTVTCDWLGTRESRVGMLKAMCTGVAREAGSFRMVVSLLFSAPLHYRVVCGTPTWLKLHRGVRGVITLTQPSATA